MHARRKPEKADTHQPQRPTGPNMEHLPAEVLHRILPSLPASAVAAAALAHPALAAAARTLPELSHVRLRLALQPGGSLPPQTRGAFLRPALKDTIPNPSNNTDTRFADADGML